MSEKEPEVFSDTLKKLRKTRVRPLIIGHTGFDVREEWGEKE